MSRGDNLTRAVSAEPVDGVEIIGDPDSRWQQVVAANDAMMEPDPMPTGSETPGDDSTVDPGTEVCLAPVAVPAHWAGPALDHFIGDVIVADIGEGTDGWEFPGASYSVELR